MVLLLIFVETFCALLAFIPSVCIKTWIIKFILKGNFKNILFKIIWINFITIVIGYFAQGFMRLIISSFFWGPGVILGEFMHGLTGNIGSEFYPMDLFEKNPIGTITELVTSYILTFLLAIIMERIVERKILEKLYHNEEKKRLIPIAVLKANSISYSILFVWITFFVATN